MSIVEDIQLIVQLHEEFKCKSKNLQDPASRHFYPSLQQYSHILLQQYQALKHIVSRACLVLSTARQQYQQHRNKSDQAQALLEQNKTQIHSLQEQLEKLHERITYFESEEETLKDEIAHLHNVIGQKQKQSQAKEEIHSHIIQQLKDQNAMLNQYSENLALKFKNLQIIIQNQLNKREKLEQAIGAYKQHQKEFMATINQLTYKSSQQAHEREIMMQVIAEKQAQIKHLQCFLNPADQPLQQVQPMDYQEQGHNQLLQFNAQVSTQLKLLQLSEQITHQNVYINLNSSSNTIEQQINADKSSKISRSPKFALPFRQNTRKGSEQIVLRKVASNADISHSKNRNILKMPKKSEESKDEASEQQLQSFANRIDKQAQNKLKSLYLLNANKVIVETQGTDRQCETDQSVCPQNQIKQQPKDTLLADPYYIHYLLTVQSIKIEEDEEGIYGILEIDMKPYYSELVKTKITLPKWGDWIRAKLIELSSVEEQV